MILILDDDQERHSWFKKKFSNAQHFTSANKFIEFVEQNHSQIKTIFLDHDLGDCTDENSYDTEYGRKTIDGWDVCRHLVKNNLCKEAQIIIHSANPDGANRMYNTLTQCGYIDVSKCNFLALKSAMKVNQSPDELLTEARTQEIEELISDLFNSGYSFYVNTHNGLEKQCRYCYEVNNHVQSCLWLRIEKLAK